MAELKWKNVGEKKYRSEHEGVQLVITHNPFENVWVIYTNDGDPLQLGRRISGGSRTLAMAQSIASAHVDAVLATKQARQGKMAVSKLIEQVKSLEDQVVETLEGIAPDTCGEVIQNLSRALNLLRHAGQGQFEDKTERKGFQLGDPIDMAKVPEREHRSDWTDEDWERHTEREREDELVGAGDTLEDLLDDQRAQDELEAEAERREIKDAMLRVGDLVMVDGRGMVLVVTSFYQSVFGGETWATVETKDGESRNYPVMELVKVTTG